MFRLKLTNNSAAQRSLNSHEQKSAASLFASWFMLMLILMVTLLLGTTLSANASTEQQDRASLHDSLQRHQTHLKDTATSHYLIPRMALIQYSTIFINKDNVPAVKLPNRKLSTPIEAYNNSIDLLVSNGEFVTPRATINLLNPNAINGNFHAPTETYLSGGSALGAVLRMSLKSWWKNNEGSQLHSMSKAAPESVRTGKLAGKAKFNWDYSLKVSYDDVKLRFERDF